MNKDVKHGKNNMYIVLEENITSTFLRTVPFDISSLYSYVENGIAY